MSTAKQDPVDNSEAGHIHSRRSLLPGSAVAAATVALLGSGLPSSARAAAASPTINSPAGGPISKVTAAGKIVQLDPKPLVTPMFTSSNVQLGPEGVLTDAQRIDDLRPLIGLASVEPGSRFSSLMHDGLGLLVLIPSLSPAKGERRSDVQIVFDGELPLRTDHNGGTMGPEGAREFVIFTNAYATIPFFTDPTDPLVQSVYKSLPDGGAAWRSRPTPAKWKDPAPRIRNPLDRAKHARTARGVTTYLCQLGPRAWSTEFDYYDPTPYVALVDFEPGASIPASWHNGWSGVGVIDGAVDIAGIDSTEGAFVLFEPLARHQFKAGPKGASVIMFFDSGRAAFPVWDNPSDPTAVALMKALRVPT
jgi:hypothetical protein